MIWWGVVKPGSVLDIDRLSLGGTIHAGPRQTPHHQGTARKCSHQLPLISNSSVLTGRKDVHEKIYKYVAIVMAINNTYAMPVMCYYTIFYTHFAATRK